MCVCTHEDMQGINKLMDCHVFPMKATQFMGLPGSSKALVGICCSILKKHRACVWGGGGCWGGLSSPKQQL